MIEERDIYVAMRDGTRLAVDVYRPDAPGKYPVLYASALHNKDIQGPDIADILPPQPAHAPLWFGPIEAGDTRRFIANGYVHVIAQPRGSAKSEGHYGHEDTDHYDLIEWITQQAVVRRQGRHGRHLRICRRAMARGRAGTSGAESHLSVRRLQRLWRHVRIPRLQSRWRTSFLPLFARRLQHGSRIARPARRTYRRGGGTLASGDAESRLQAVHQPLQHPHPEGSAHLHHVSHDDASLGVRRHRRARRRGLQENQDTVLHRLRSLCLHLQAPLARRAALFPECRCAEEAAVYRAGAPRAAVPSTPRRDHPLV